MTERDPKVSQRYRELDREEPPRALDDAIFAASRRSVQKRIWNRPVAIAAVIVLAVAVTVHVQREQPAEDLVTASRIEPARPRAFTPDPKPQPALAPPVLTDSREGAAAAPAEQLMMRRSESARDTVTGARESARADAAVPQPASPQAAPPAPPVVAAKPAPVPDAARAPARAMAAPEMRAGATAGARAGTASILAYASPEQWLLGIDDLKRQGKHDEAERQLAEFRRRYPNYRIPEAITEKFERR